MSDKPDSPSAVDDSTADEIASLAALISQARELVASGHTIDLAGLSEKVNAFCLELAKNPPADRESVARMIEALVGDLNTLADEITAQHDKLVADSKKGNGS